MQDQPIAFRLTGAGSGEELAISTQQRLSIIDPTRSIRELLAARSPGPDRMGTESRAMDWDLRSF